MKPKQSNLTIFAILTTITILTWVFVEAYQKFYKIELATIPANIISPLTPTFDSQTLESIRQKRQLTEDELSVLSPRINPEQTPEPIPTPQAEEVTEEAGEEVVTVSPTPTPTP